jgi:hypothetical protein
MIKVTRNFITMLCLTTLSYSEFLIDTELCPCCIEQGMEVQIMYGCHLIRQATSRNPLSLSTLQAGRLDVVVVGISVLRRFCSIRVKDVSVCWLFTEFSSVDRFAIEERTEVSAKTC